MIRCKIFYLDHWISDKPLALEHLPVINTDHHMTISLLQEILQQAHGLLWFDSSIRFKCPLPLGELDTKLRESGICLVLKTSHSVYSATNQRIYTYFPTNVSLFKEKEMFGGGLISVINTKSIYKYILNRLIMCSLTKDCIDPMGSNIFCKFQKNRYRLYASCHRYDMSVLNILLLHYFKGNVGEFTHSETCFATERRPTFQFKLQFCQA